MEDMLNT